MEQPSNNSDEQNFPLHRATVQRDLSRIRTLLEQKLVNINERDWHGNPALHLAIHLRFLDVVKLLLAFDADPTVSNAGGWSALHEAIACREKEIIKEILTSIQKKVRCEMQQRIPVLIEALSKLPDFYMELKWEFKSWVPLLSRLCPSDVYKIWKRGSSLRVDTTLIGFERLRWKRGNISIQFLGKDTETPGVLLLVDHDNKIKENFLHSLGSSSSEDIDLHIDDLLKHSIIKSDVHSAHVKFNPCYSWFGSERLEKISGFDAKIYDIEGFEYNIVSRHLKPEGESTSSQNAPLIPAYYFKRPTDSATGGYGLLYKTETVTKKSRQFRGYVWISHTFPRCIQELYPIFEILSPKVKHFEKLKAFVEHKMPDSGFPIKLEVPVFPTLSAVVSFQSYVEKSVDAKLLQVPAHYKEGLVHLDFDFDQKVPSE